MIIVRYLTRETIKSQIAVLFILFLVFFSQRFIRVLGSATEGSIPSDLILTFIALYMPSMGLLLLPLSLYVGILLTFGRLYAESEITVMNATGIGNKFLIQAAMVLALMTGAVAAYNAFWLTPWANEKEVQLREQLASESGLDLLIKGQFQQAPDGRAVVFIDDITQSGRQLENVFVAQPIAMGGLRPSVLTAETGVVSELPDGRQVLELRDGERVEGLPTRLDYTVTEFESYQVLIGQRAVREHHRDWDAIGTLELMRNSNPYAQAEFQWRVSLVLCIPLLTMVVVPLSSVNPRQGRFAKLLPAILLYLAYFLSISAGKSAVEDEVLPSYIGLWGINAALLGVAIVLNSLDSLAVRKLKDKWRRRRANV
ncbi:LPS export ABC transporter permease LptF [Thaumasiovibrio subtropicus]|uniref:LPS export ABC transporter permease LptF n=1 Tax=Thaumasiovibrio subtropicus TaxID=1891207 RepID=UPI000B350280|nr:LPS export ABC transporter permease LptF [Thaumasiovibrio subtropicus]